MSYEVNVLADSISEAGKRITTFEVVFPRFILAEVNTHRTLSRNSASSRAIPPERIIREVQDNPFVPTFNKRVKGMGVGELLDSADMEEAESIWLWARGQAVEAANALLLLDVDKSRVNRLLEPFMWHTAIITATEWDNFFALRTDEGAQPEFRIIAEMMETALLTHTPEHMPLGHWHIPLVSKEELWEGCDSAMDVDWVFWSDVAVGRLARRSSYNRMDPEPVETSHERTVKLSGNGHWSPFEHVASPMKNPEQPSGNFRGWVQYRKGFPHEDNFAKLKALHEGI